MGLPINNNKLVKSADKRAFEALQAEVAAIKAQLEAMKPRKSEENK